MEIVMEFNVLPHAKLLSPSNRSASGAAVKSDNKASQTATQTVNVILPNSSQVDEPSVSIREPEPQVNKEIVQANDVQDPTATINFLKLVLESYINNPIKYNGLIICTVPLLEHLIEILTGCDNCSIELVDEDIGCCGVTNKKYKQLIRYGAVMVIAVKSLNINIASSYKYLNHIILA